MNPQQIKEHNEGIAEALMTIAQYIASSEDKVTVRIGIKMRIRKYRMNIPVTPVEKVVLQLADWGSQEIIKIVRKYQKENDSQQGEELVAAMQNARQYLGVDKPA